MTVTGLGPALVRLRDVLASTRYPLMLPNADEAERLGRSVAGQLDDYLLPRLARLDAPLLCVVGGSTGAGKSTLVNSIVRAPVSIAGARRPTTRSPVLVCNPADAGWFEEAKLLPNMGRAAAGHTGIQHGLRIVPTPVLSPGLALLDSPDIDSVEEANRVLAEQLLAAADLWLFVTTAVRYADAVPWELLTDARDRGTSVAMVLNRIPPGAEQEVAPHLSEMLAGHGLGNVRIFGINEQELGEGMLPVRSVGPLRDWLATLAESSAARAAVIRQTVDGAVAALGPSTERLARESDAQTESISALKHSADSAYREAELVVDQGVRDGVLFRGEVLSRWQELVGTGEFMRNLQARVGVLRDKLVSAVTGKPRPAEQLKSALESGLVTLVHSAAADAAEQAAASWRAHPGGAALLAANRQLTRPSPDIDEQIGRVMRDWQRAVLELVRTESGKKLFAAKASAYAVNVLGLCLMIAVFAATAFIPTGAEIAVAGGTTLAAQKILEAIFGDEVVRRLAAQARQDLLTRVGVLLNTEAARFHAALETTGVDPEAGQRLRAAAAAVEAARRADPVGTPAGPPAAGPSAAGPVAANSPAAGPVAAGHGGPNPPAAGEGAAGPPATGRGGPNPPAKPPVAGPPGSRGSGPNQPGLTGDAARAIPPDSIPPGSANDGRTEKLGGDPTAKLANDGKTARFGRDDETLPFGDGGR
jgi:hypothetical protein